MSSNYWFDLVPRTWDFIRATPSGTAVFTMSSGPIKCADAPTPKDRWDVDEICARGGPAGANGVDAKTTAAVCKRRQ